jgi:hypothetical protein
VFVHVRQAERSAKSTTPMAAATETTVGSSEAPGRRTNDSATTGQHHFLICRSALRAVGAFLVGRHLFQMTGPSKLVIMVAWQGERSEARTSAGSVIIPARS